MNPNRSELSTLTAAQSVQRETAHIQRVIHESVESALDDQQRDAVEILRDMAWQRFDTSKHPASAYHRYNAELVAIDDFERRLKEKRS